MPCHYDALNMMSEAGRCQELQKGVCPLSNRILHDLRSLFSVNFLQIFFLFTLPSQISFKRIIAVLYVRFIFKMLLCLCSYDRIMCSLLSRMPSNFLSNKNEKMKLFKRNFQISLQAKLQGDAPAAPRTSRFCPGPLYLFISHLGSGHCDSYWMFVISKTKNK